MLPTTHLRASLNRAASIGVASLPIAIATGILTWNKAGTSERVGSVGYSVERQDGALYVELDYTVTYQGKREECNERVQVVWTRPNYGGYRFWWICPVCERRKGVLYRPNRGKYFACRTCYGLTYDSTRRDRVDDLAARIWKIRGRLKAKGGLTDPLPWLKPNYMHWKTYTALVQEYRELEVQFWQATVEMLSL